ncbi:ATP-binding protein [Streptomyces sp. G45]|uniref:ATP-binding protein n=1 Tax=Streptomyces sp. G45 TaxID=3406627 RepID=UPI003C13FE15
MRRPQHPDRGRNDSAAAPGTPGDPPAVPGNLPAELTAFVGRSAELARLTEALASARLVTVTGVGGVGKSRLAVRAAAAVRPPDGAWLVELASVRDATLVEHAVASALELTDHTSRAPRQVLLDRLAGRELLLVVDGFEHLVDAAASFVRELLLRCPGLKVLAAGRRPLGTLGEHVVPLAPLPEAEAAELFADRAAACLPGFSLDSLDGAARADVLELCRRLDGIPLAVELAAGRLRALSPGQLLARLDDRFRLLRGPGRDAPSRHHTLRTAIGWSHELCTAQERLLWARLSVFSGPFDLEAVEYVCSGAGLHADDVLDVLDELLAQSVLAREESPTGVRFRMLDTVRAYGADWLAAMGDTDRMRRRHRDWYMGLATWCELDWFSPRQEAVATLVECELPNLRAALEFCLTDPEETHLGQYLAGTLWFCWVGCGRLAEGRHWLDRAVELDGGHEDSRLKALWVLGYVAILQGDTVPALSALQECQDTAERSGSAVAAAYATHRMGCLALVSDDMPRAERLLRSALEAYRRIGELNSNVLMGQVELAMALAFQGSLGDAVELCEDVRRICEDHGERWTLAYALYVLGYAAWTRGEPVRARELVTECLALDHTFHDLLGTVLAVELLALFTVSEGDAAEAAVLQGVAARIWPSVGLPLFGSEYFGAPHALCEAKAREGLGDARYEACVRSGEALTTDAAVARALGRDRGAALEGRQRRPGGTPASYARKPAASPAPKGGETTG